MTWMGLFLHVLSVYLKLWQLHTRAQNAEDHWRCSHCKGLGRIPGFIKLCASAYSNAAHLDDGEGERGPSPILPTCHPCQVKGSKRKEGAGSERFGGQQRHARTGEEDLSSLRFHASWRRIQRFQKLISLFRWLFLELTKFFFSPATEGCN